MSSPAKIAQTPNVAIFTRDLLEFLEGTAKKEPHQLVTFRAGNVWRGAKDAVDVHGPRKIYFAPMGGKGLVEYEAVLEKVVLHPEPNTNVGNEAKVYHFKCFPVLSE